MTHTERTAAKIESGNFPFTKKEIISLYETGNKALSQIATITGLSRTTVRNLFIYWGVKLKPVGNWQARVVDKPLVEVPMKMLSEEDIDEDLKTILFK